MWRSTSFFKGNICLMASVGTRFRKLICRKTGKTNRRAIQTIFSRNELVCLFLFVNKHINSKEAEADEASIWVYQACTDWWGSWWFWSNYRRSTFNLLWISTSREIAAMYWSLHTLRRPNVSNVLTISSILIDVFTEISFKLHQQSVSFRVCIIINVQKRR